MNYKGYFAIESRIKRQGFDVDRSELVSDFTSGETNRLSDLSEFKYRVFLKWLERKFQLKSKPHWEGTPEDKMRKKLIQLFVHEMGYTMDGLNEWCIKYGQFHKRLNDHSGDELAKLVSIAKTKVYPQFMKKITSIK